MQISEQQEDGSALSGVQRRLQGKKVSKGLSKGLSHKLGASFLQSFAKWDNIAMQASEDVVECGDSGNGTMTQTEAITFVTTVNVQKQEKLQKMVKFVTDFEQLLYVQVKEIHNLVSTQLAPAWQVNRIA